MDQEKKVNVELTTTEVKNLLLRYLDAPECDKVANLIVGHLALSELGLGHLFKSLIGIFPTLKYMPKHFVWVNLAALPSWRMNKEKTAELPGVKDNFILAEIVDCNVYKSYPYKVRYMVIKDGVTEPAEELTEIAETTIRERAEDFVDILDALEALKNEKDLPF